MRLALPSHGKRSPYSLTLGRRWGLGLAVVPILVAAYLAWPYVTLWRLDRALVADDREALARLVDLDSVRDQILRRLNKESASVIGPVSDAFIDWLQHAIRQNGTKALAQRVSLDWVRDRLLAHSGEQQGLTPALSQATFTDPVHVKLRIGAPDREPVWAILSFRGVGWRLTALYH